MLTINDRSAKLIGRLESELDPLEDSTLDVGWLSVVEVVVAVVEVVVVDGWLVSLSFEATFHVNSSDAQI